MKLGISCESTSDLEKNYIIKEDIRVIPLAIHFGTEEYLDGVNISPSDIFNRVKEGSDFPKTSARSVGDYIEFFNEMKKEYDTILHIAFSSELSCSYQNAILASQEVDGVYVVDSKSLSSGHGLVVMTAVEERAKENDISQIISNIENIVPKVSTTFIINSMNYLNKGGRCSAIASFAASLLKIKPSIKLVDGKMAVGKKYMGKINEEVLRYVDDTLKDNPNCSKDKIYLVYSSQDLIDTEKVKNKLQSYGFEKIYECFSGCTISTHCGPNTLGIMFINK